jgi:phosphatidate cytidylyltransferase
VPAQAEPPGTVARGRWGDFGRRAASAAVLAPLALACLWVGGWAWVALVLLLTVGLLAEWMRLARAITGPAVGANRHALRLAGVAYIAIAALALIWLRGDAVAGRANVFFVLMVVWASDVGAYLAGRLIGGKRLAPRISPGKTWSGSAGGLLAAVLVGAVARAAPGAVAVGVLLGLIAQAGDLLESAVKRWAGVKDSGALIPGHGGLLDRLDGVLAAAPAAALLALVLGRGVVLWQ